MAGGLEVAPEVDHLPALDIAKIERWGPRSCRVGEAFNVQRSGGSALWFVFLELDRFLDYRIHVGSEAAVTTINAGKRLITARITSDQSRRITSKEGLIPVHLVDPVRGKQLIGYFEVKPKLDNDAETALDAGAEDRPSSCRIFVEWTEKGPCRSLEKGIEERSSHSQDNRDRTLVSQHRGWRRYQDGGRSRHSRVRNRRITPSDRWADLADAVPGDLSGKRILDIGSADGFFTLEFARRGADEVVAMDPWTKHINRIEWLKDYFDLGNITPVVGKVEQLTVENYGEFDLIFMLGLLYHLKDPLTGPRGSIRAVRCALSGNNLDI